MKSRSLCVAFLPLRVLKMVQLSVHSSAVDGMEQVLRRMKIGVSILVSAASHQVDW